MTDSKAPLLIWNDEEPQYLDISTRSFENKGWIVEHFRTPEETKDFLLEHDTLIDDAVLVVDLMMPFFDNGIYDRSATDDGFLTGLQLLRELEDEKRLNVLHRFRAVFIYSALAEQQMKGKVDRWIKAMKLKHPNLALEFVSKIDVNFYDFPERVQEELERKAA